MQSASDRRAKTRREITAYARRLTASSGLQGFTVEDLCEHVGISRRTFFNYFPGKEQAVIGEHSDGLDAVAVQDFLDRRPADATGISPTLLDDLLDLIAAHFSSIGLSPEEAGAFFAAAHREPKLIEQLMHWGEEHHRYMTTLVGRREGLDPEHPVSHMALVLAGAIGQSGMREFLDQENRRSLPEIFSDRLAAAKQVFAPALRD